MKEKLAGRVTFLGRPTQAEAIEHVRDADLFVQPSFVDMFSMAVIEAMAAGIPVVAIRVRALPELVVDGETGVLVGPGDPETLADRIIFLLNDSSLSEQMGRTRRARAGPLFSWDKMVVSVESVYGSEHFARELKV